MRILGIDPGLASTGIGIIEQRGDSWRVVECHEVRTSTATPLAQRLQRIHDLVADAIAEFHPDAVAVESVFFAKNVRSVVMMAHGRGVAILAASSARIPVFEYSPLEIKQSVVGKGRASKEQVMQMIKILFGLAELPPSDHQADALACALAHAYRSRLHDQLESQKTTSSAEKPAQPTVSAAKLMLAQARKPRRKRR